MRGGKLKAGSQSLLLVVLLLAILILVNFLSLRAFVRLDLTQNQEFTISPASRHLLGKLPDLVHIKVYFSRDLPPYLVGLRRRVEDLLDEYRAYSGGKLRVEFVDPESDLQREQQVQQLGIPKLQLNIIEKDKAQVKPAYLGLAVLYEDKKEIIPIIRRIDNLEYELTARISKLTRPETKTIGFLQGHQEWDIYEEYSRLRQALEKQYEVITVETAQGRPVADEVDTLVVAKPEGLSRRDKYELDQFLMRGGKLVLLLDWVKLERGLTTTTIDSKLEDLLKHYGVRLNHDLVLDGRFNAPASFSTGFFNFRIPYPYWVRVVKQGLAADHPALADLETVVFPWTSSLTLLEEKLAEHEVIRLASSSSYSWNRISRYFTLNPQQRFIPPGEDRLKSHLLAVAISGSFSSFYADKEIPPVAKGDKPEEQAEEELKLEAEGERKTIPKSPETQLLVISNSRLLTNNFINQFRGNALFFLNLIDWLNVGPELIKIRARQVNDRPLKEISDRQKGYIKFANSLGAALLVVVFGLVKLYLRRRAQRRYQLAVEER
jgi:gliding-associated putative ABC transporter substrate-binding component GldG